MALGEDSSRVLAVEPTELFEHIRLGRAEKVSESLKTANLEQTNHFGFTALLYAVACNQLKIVELLIQGGANANHQDKRGFGALHTAALKDFTPIFTVLLEKGADPSMKTLADEFAYQVAEGKERKVKYAKLMGMEYVSRFGETIEEADKLFKARHS